MQLEEGRRYLFDVEKTISFDDDEFYVLRGDNNRKHLLSKSEYRNYNINHGDKIDCRVDKINCKGEIFLEPLHPYYAEGQQYSFRVMNREERVDKDGRKTGAIRLETTFGDEIILDEKYFADDLPLINSELILQISRISKGQLFISDERVKHVTEKEQGLDIFDFELIDESAGLDNKNYYIISDSRGKTYTIRKDYYSHYGLRKGRKFKGRFVVYKDGADVNVEPLNPWFEPGLQYSFEVAEIIRLSDSDDFIIVEDKWGGKHKVAFRRSLSVGDSVSYRVEKMRKGWPLLIEV